MSIREVCWGVFLVGLPFAHFFCPYPIDINQYAAQNFWAYGGLAVLFGLSLSQHSEPRSPRNLPLACWMIWTVVSVLWIWADVMRRAQQHPIGLLPPFIHYMGVIFFYLAATRQWTPAVLSRLLTWVAYSGMVVVAYGVLQVFGMDQFYRQLVAYLPKDVLMGTIGNPTHFGLHLALLLPIFLWQPQWWWKLVAVMATGLVGLTLSTSALVLTWGVWLWWGWHEQRRVCWVVGLGGGLLGLLLFWRFPVWLNAEGRVQFWQYLWQLYMVGQQKLQITGAGLGRVLNDSLQNLPGWPSSWRHAHQEFFQILIEQGVIGLSLVCWGLGDAIRRWGRLPPTPLAKMLAGIGMVFLFSSLLHFSAHLWILSSLGLVAYCGVYVLSAEEVLATPVSANEGV